MKPSRPASPTPAPSHKLERDTSLWFDDGNLILVAHNTEFKVYQGPLVTHSPVFNDMLSLPQPDTHAARDSAPPAVVHLTDSPEDLRYFLRAFMSGLSLRAGQHNPTFDEVSACIRLGHKYQIDNLVQANMDFLRKFYTDSFEDWYPSTFVRPPEWQALHSIGVVNLARLTGTDAMLPTALMDCCTLGAEIVRGLPRADGAHEALSADDLGRCFEGRTRMAQASARIAHRMFRASTAPGCRRPVCCARVLARLLGELANAKDDVISCVDWYASWMVYVDSRDEERELCIKCYRMLEGERPRLLQREVWDRLPAMMGVEVPGWGKKLKAET